MTEPLFFLFHQRSAYGAANRIDRLASSMEADSIAQRLVAEEQVPAASKLSMMRALVKARRKLLEDAAAIVVFGELEILAIATTMPGLLARTVYLQREDNGEKYFYQSVPPGSAGGRIRSAVWRALQKLLLPRLRGVVVQTRLHESRLRLRCGAAAPAIEVVPNDIPPPFRTMQKCEPVAGRLRAGFICGSNPVRKGVDLITGVLPDDIGLHLLIASEQLGALRQVAPDLVETAARIEQDGDTSQFLDEVDFLFVPTRYDECPNVVLEALGAGRPMLVSDIAAHRALLGDEYAGYLAFERASPAQLRDKLSNGQLALLREQLEARRERFLFNWESEMRAAIFRLFEQDRGHA